MRTTWWVVAACAACCSGGGGAVAADPGEGTEACELRPFQTVDNGVGAEPGVEREFASGMSVPAQCLRGGRTWIPRMGVNLTRTAAGPANNGLRILGRRPLSAEAALPADVLWGEFAVQVQDVPLFPGSTYYTFDTVRADGNVNNILWGDYFYVDAVLDGDASPQVFITADLVGTPGAVPCFTGIGGAVPNDRCTTGQPALEAVGLGCETYAFYSRYVDGGHQVMGNREIAGSTFAARYLGYPGRAPEGGIDLRFLEGRDGPVICQFFDIPPDFEASCPLTVPQGDLLEAGGVFAELTFGAGAPMLARFLPAGLHVFADGFESGDTSVWSATVQ